MTVRTQPLRLTRDELERGVMKRRITIQPVDPRDQPPEPAKPDLGTVAGRVQAIVNEGLTAHSFNLAVTLLRQVSDRLEACERIIEANPQLAQRAILEDLRHGELETKP